MECIFCKIASGDLASETLYNDDTVRVFKDIHPKAPIHFLIIPKTHIESIASLKEKDGKNIAGSLVYAAKQVAEQQGIRGYKLVFNVGREGGQIIDHVHLHLLAGWSNLSHRTVNV